MFYNIFVEFYKKIKEKTNMSKIYDCIIIGGGTSGISALLYLGRGLTNSLLIESKIIGGQITNTPNIENYLGLGDIDTYDYIENIKNHAMQFAPEAIVYDEVSEIVDIDKGIKILKTADGEEYQTKSLILSMGASTRKANIKGEAEFMGRGVSTCATCDGAFFRDKEVAIVGGGESAFEEALFLTRFVSKIYLVHRRQGFRASEIAIKRLKDTGKVEFILDSVIDEIYGEAKVLGIKIKNVLTNDITDKKIDGVFMFIGHDPNTSIVENTTLELSESKYIKTDINMHTNIDGVFACGDIIEKNVRQLISAAGDGAVAATEAIKYLETL